jgi:fluoroacetyl-CoA thioesterase
MARRDARAINPSRTQLKLLMTPIEPGIAYAFTIETGASHSAEAFGNANVNVVGTAALIGLIERAAERCARACYDSGEASVGTGVHVRHISPAPVGARLEVRARLVHVNRRKLGFDVEVAWGDNVLMIGTHDRAVVDLDDFLGRTGVAPLGIALAAAGASLRPVD